MDSQNYAKDGVARVTELLKDSLGASNYTFFDSELFELETEDLPCVMVSETTGHIETDATGTDLITETVRITIVLDKSDDIGGPQDKNLTQNRLRKIVKGQYPSTSGIITEYIPNTIVHTLRVHITMDESVVNNSIDTEFGSNFRGQDIATEEARITVTTQRFALVPQRD